MSYVFKIKFKGGNPQRSYKEATDQRERLITIFFIFCVMICMANVTHSNSPSKIVKSGYWSVVRNYMPKYSNYENFKFQKRICLLPQKWFFTNATNNSKPWIWGNTSKKVPYKILFQIPRFGWKYSVSSTTIIEDCFS